MNYNQVLNLLLELELIDTIRLKRKTKLGKGFHITLEDDFSLVMYLQNENNPNIIEDVSLFNEDIIKYEDYYQISELKEMLYKKQLNDMLGEV